MSMQLDGRFFSVVLASAILLAGVAVAQEAAPTAPQAALSNPLSLVPADAWLVVVIDDVSKISTQVDAYAKALNKEPLNIESEWVKRLGMGAGIAADQPTILVVMNRTVFGDQPLAVLLPIKDYQAVSNMVQAKPTETPGIMTGENPEFKKLFFARKGGYLLAAPTEELVKSVLTSKQDLASVLGKDSASLLDKSDIYFRANLPPISEMIKPYLMLATMMGPGMMGMPGGMGPGGEPPMDQAGMPQNPQVQAMQAMSKMVTGLADLLDQATSYEMGFSLEPQTISVTYLMGFKPGTEIAAMIAEQKPTETTELKGLPAKDFFFAMGYRWEPKLIKFYNAMFEMSGAMGLPPELAQQYVQLSKDSFLMAKGVAAMVSMKMPSPGTGMLGVDWVVETADAGQYIEKMRQAVGLMAQAKIPGPDGQMITPNVRYEQNVATVGGVPVDRYVMDLNSLMAMPGADPQMAQQINMFLGMAFGAANGQIATRIAKVSDNLVVLDIGGDDASLQQLIEAAKSGSTAVAQMPKVQQARKQLFDKQLAVGYLDLGKIINMIAGFQQMMVMMGGQAGTETAPAPQGEMPLIAFAKTVTDTMVQGRLVVPMEVIQQIVPLAESAAAAAEGMMGGPGAGGPVEPVEPDAGQ